MNESTKNRFYYLDALKFFSMIIVFLCHLRMAFFYDKFETINLGNIRFSNYLFSGNLAVCMFLLISVYLSAKKAYELNVSSITFIDFCVKRFIRLFVPIFFINFLIFLLFSFHLFFNINFFDETVPYVNDWFNYGNSIKAFIYMLLSDINNCFFEYGFNPPLWCYYLFFIFPLLTYGLIILISDSQKILIMSLILLPIFLLNNSYFAIIPLSIIMASKNFQENRKRTLLILMCVLLIIFCIILQSLAANGMINILNRFSISLNILLASSILALFVIMEDRNILNWKVFSYLNKISFGIYLLHMPVICSIGFFVYNNTGNLIITILTIVSILIILSLFFHIVIEKKITENIIKGIVKK